jgi:putative flippase GtrA
MSGINVANHQIVLQLAVRWFDLGGGTANLVAAFVGATGAYFLSLYWVWKLDGNPELRAHILPFWAISALGLVISTTLASAADRLWDDPLLISAGSMLGYFLVWVGKYVIFSILFDSSRETVPVA